MFSFAFPPSLNNSISASLSSSSLFSLIVCSISALLFVELMITSDKDEIVAAVPPIKMQALESRGRKVAFVTGINGQDGSYLAELLLSKGYIVHGLIRRTSSFNTKRVDHLFTDSVNHKSSDFQLHYGDMTDGSNLISLVAKLQPDEIYNLAAQSHVKVSFEVPEHTADTDGIGTLRLLEAIRLTGRQKTTKFYQASTSEMYGLVQEVPQTELTPFYPRSPYGCAKVYAYWITRNYRESYDMFTCNGILFNHESPRRGETFLTRKITRACARIHLGYQKSVVLGNLDSSRDWGHARDYVYAMWLMMQQETPDDFVIATGKQYKVRRFCEIAFANIGLNLRWEGSGMDEKGVDQNGEVRATVDEKYFRPAEVETLLGCPNKAKEVLGWVPKIEIEELAKEMIESDIAACRINPNE